MVEHEHMVVNPDHSMSGHDRHEQAGPAAHGGGGHHHGGHVQRFRRLFWIMLLLALPVVALSPSFSMLIGYEVPTEGVLAWVPPVLGTT